MIIFFFIRFIFITATKNRHVQSSIGSNKADQCRRQQIGFGQCKKKRTEMMIDAVKKAIHTQKFCQISITLLRWKHRLSEANDMFCQYLIL